MKFKLDFSLDAWIRDYEVEGDTEEEAIENARKEIMDNFNSNINTEGYMKDCEIKDVDSEVLEREITLKINRIVLDPDSYEDPTIEIPDLNNINFQKTVTIKPDDYMNEVATDVAYSYFTDVLGWDHTDIWKIEIIKTIYEIVD